MSVRRTSSAESARRFHDLGRQRRRGMSRRLAQQVMDGLDPQYADTITSRTLRAAQAVCTNFVCRGQIKAALAAVVRREELGRWDTQGETPPEVVWRACIAIWRMQREGVR